MQRSDCWVEFLQMNSPTRPLLFSIGNTSTMRSKKLEEPAMDLVHTLGALVMGLGGLIQLVIGEKLLLVAEAEEKAACAP